MGRPTDYKEEYVDQVYKLCLLGATDKEIAKFFEVTEKTINNWKEDYPEFFQSIKEGKIKADMKVAGSLHDRAAGYTYTKKIPVKKSRTFIHEGTGKVLKEDEIEIVEVEEYVPADVRAIQFWLNNRRRGKWKDQQKIDVNVKKSYDLSDEQIRKVLERKRKREEAKRKTDEGAGGDGDGGGIDDGVGEA